MRLYNIFYICKLCLPSIKVVFVEDSLKDPTVVLVRRWGDCKKSMDLLKRTFDKAIEKLYKVLDWQANKEDPRLSLADAEKIQMAMAGISASVEMLINL